MELRHATDTKMELRHEIRIPTVLKTRKNPKTASRLFSSLTSHLTSPLTSPLSGKWKTASDLRKHHHFPHFPLIPTKVRGYARVVWSCEDP
jgi:hypothetical protein